MTALMIDIETLDTAPTAKIVEIGWCVVPSSLGPYLTSLDFASGSIPVTPVGQELLGLTESKDTLEWWQDEESRRKHLQYLTEQGIPLYEALTHLARVVEIYTPSEIWCKGASFDFAILRHAYVRYANVREKVDMPWSYGIERDLRTYQAMFSTDWRKAKQQELFEKYGLTAHTAKDDAIAQAALLVTLREKE